jgi:surface glycoprotein (TIGR04207 family)/PGF-pre-PGF domain-containing protein
MFGTHDKPRAVALAVVMVVSMVVAPVTFAGPATAQTSTVTVDADETVGDNDDTYASISYALDNVSADGTVRVNGSDTYYTHEHLVSDRIPQKDGNIYVETQNVTIESFNGNARVVYNGSKAGDTFDNGGQPTMRILADDVTVRGLTLVKTGELDAGNYGQSLKIGSVTGVLVEGNRITTKNRSAHAEPQKVGGIAVEGGTATLRNNVVDDSAQGIYLYSGANVDMSGNDVQTVSETASIDPSNSEVLVLDAASTVNGNSAPNAIREAVLSGNTVDSVRVDSVTEAATESTDDVTDARATVNVSVGDPVGVDEDSIDVRVLSAGTDVQVVEDGSVVNGTATAASTLDGSDDAVESINVSVALPAGSYEFRVDANDTNGDAIVDGAVPGGDDDAFTITANDPANFVVDRVTSTDPVTTGDTLDVTATVENTAFVESTQQLTLSANGSQRDSASITLGARESVTRTLSWSTDGTDPGDYTLTVGTANDTNTSVSASVVEGETVAESSVGGDGSATVDVGGTDVQSAEVTLPSGSGAGSVTVAEASAPTGDAPEPDNDVATYLDVSADRSVSDEVEVSVTVPSSTLGTAGIEPESAALLHYVDGEWTELDTEVTTGGGTVTLTGTASSLSPFAVGARSEPAGGGGGGGGGGVDGEIAVAQTRVTESFSGATAERAAVEFGDPVTGSVSIEALDTLPAGVTAPDGAVIAAVEITTPDVADGRDSTVEITVPRDDIGADATAEDFRIVRLEGAAEPEPLDTEVVESGDRSVTVAAETAGFSVFAVVEPAATAAASTATGTPTPEPTATGTPTPEPTATGTPTPEPTATGTSTPEPTTGGGPGFGPVAALLAFVAGVVALIRRRRG